MKPSDEELAALYVLDQLDTRERADFEARLLGEPKLAETVRELETTLAARVRALPQHTAPGRLQARVEAAIEADLLRGAHREREEPVPATLLWRRWSLLGGLAAVVLVGLGFVLSEQRHSRQGASPIVIAVLDSRGSALAEVPLEGGARTADGRFVQLASLAEQYWDNPSQLPVRPEGNGGGQGYALFDPATRQGFIAVRQVPPAGEGQRYRLWVVDPGTGRPRDAGVLPLAASTRGLFFFSLPETKGDANATAKFFVTVEEANGPSADAPRGKVVLGDRTF